MDSELSLLEESQRLLWGILLGVALQLRSLELQRLGLLGGEPQGRIEGLQLSASALSAWALMGFWRQSLEVPGGDQGLAGASLIIGLLRLMKLLPGGGSAGEEEFTGPTG